MKAIEELIDDFLSGHDQAFKEIVLNYQDMALFNAQRILKNSNDIEDVVQDAFLDAYDALKKQRLKDHKAFAAWLRTIIKTRCNRVLRKQKPMIMDELPEIEDHSSPSNQLEVQEVKERIHNLLIGLNEKQQMVINLYYMDGNSTPQIAEKLSVPITTVKKRLHDGRNKLRERMFQMMKSQSENDFSFQKPTDNDWTSIRALADDAAPNIPKEAKDGWLQNRKQVGQMGKGQASRRHLVAKDDLTGQIIAYGALECISEPGRFRVFIVMNPSLLETLGDLMYEKLMEGTEKVDPDGFWVREFAEETELLRFFEDRGFHRRYEFTIDGVGDLVVLKKNL